MKPHRATTFALSLIAVLTLLCGFASAQAGGEMQQKLAAMKEAAAQNKQNLRQYQWTETQTLTYKGEQKPSKQFLCSYGPDGRVQKTPMGEQAPQAQEQSGGRRGRLKEHVIEKKKEEMQDYMQSVQALISAYVPPDKERMQQAFQNHNVSLSPGGGAADLVFKNYVKQGDQMTIAIDPSTKKMQSLNVKTYMQEPKDEVTLNVQFGTLPDGTNYPKQTNLDATAKQIQVMTTNYNYTKLAQ